MVFENEIMITSFSTSGYISSVLFDPFGYMIVLDRSYYLASIYYFDGTYMNIAYQTNGEPIFINFDYNGNLVINSLDQSNFYKSN